jgi:hydrogenase-1 operon protein HyaE
MPSPSIRRLTEQYRYPVVGVENLDAFLRSHEDVVLFFTENPSQYPESNDVAVILPELMKVYVGMLTAAVIDRDSDRELQRRYGFTRWPALVFLRRGEYLGAITQVRGWSDYLDEVGRILKSAPSRPPGIGIAAVGANRPGCGNRSGEKSWPSG